MSEMSELLEALRNETMRDLRFAFSRDGKKVWVNEALGRGDFRTLSPQLSKTHMVGWLKGFQSAIKIVRTWIEE